MKKLLYSLLLILAIAGYSYSDTVVDGVGGGGVSEGTDVGFKNMTATSLKLGAGTVSNPALTIGANSKLFEATPGVLNFVTNGSSSWEMLEAGIRGLTNGNAYLVMKLVSSDTVAVHAFRGNGADDGLGGPPNVPTMIADATPVASFALHTTTFYKNGTGQVKIDDQGNITATGSIEAAIQTYADLSNTADQTFAGTGTGYAILFNTNDHIQGITHSTSVDTENITIITSGVYAVFAQPQVTAGAAGDFHMWLQVDTGGGFADIANSNVKLAMAINTEEVIPLILTLPLEAGDKFRLMGSVTNTAIILDAEAPGGEPVIPAIILSMHKL